MVDQRPGLRYAPPVVRDDLVARDGLLADLDRSSESVVCLRAPAGYGKTILLSQWARRTARPCAWMTLDEACDDPVVLARRLSEAISATQPAAVVVEHAELSAPALAEQLQDTVTPFLLVLDDAHAVTDPATAAVLDGLLSAMPGGSQTALASRIEPALRLARLRAAGRVLDITSRDLAMDRAEVRAMLAESGQSAQTLDTVLTCSEGWPVAVSLCARSARLADAGGRGRAPIVVGAERVSVGYLRAELWSDLDDHTMRFLTRSSILAELDGPLCDAVLARQGSGVLLRRLANGNLPMIALDSRDDRFRYHRLLRDALRSELVRRESPSVPLLHARASRWFEGRHEQEAAIWHANQAGDAAATARLAWSDPGVLFTPHAASTADRWLAPIADADLAGSPELSALAAWAALLRGEANSASGWLRCADAGFAVRAALHPGPARSTLPLLHILRGDLPVPDMARWATATAEQFPPRSPWRPFALLVATLAHAFTASRSEATIALRRARMFALETGAESIGADCRAILGAVAADRHGARAEAGPRDTRDTLAAADPTTGMLAAITASALAAAATRSGDLAGARHHLARARRLGGPTAFGPWLQALCGTWQATAALALGDVSGARTLVRDARRALDGRPDPTCGASDARAGVPGIRDVRLGRTVVDECELAMRSSGAAAPVSPLTTAEWRVLPYLTTHLTFREIADGLYLSRHTVKTQALSVYHKLGATSRTEAVQRARHLGLIADIALADRA